tara:strand:+ start:824 stop:1204 length:381 start_codon:yes stop_codon:yes gene_type:complete
MKTKKLLSLKERRKLAKDFIENNGACYFDFKKRDIIFPDGGLFSIEKIIKKRPRYRKVKIKGEDFYHLKDIKGKKIKYEDYEATVWIEDVTDMINYLKRLEKVLIKMGYNPKQSIEWQKRTESQGD